MLIKRNLLIYFRNRSAVFFSLLASIITLCLYLFFINKSMINSIGDKVKDIETLKVFLNSIVICGVVCLNAFTIPLSFMNMLVNDRESGVLKDFFVSPIKKTTVTLSYIICSVIATAIINIVVITLLIGYLYINDVLSFDFISWAIALLLYLLANFLFSIIAFFVANFIENTNAYGNLIGLSSALVGFLSGVYMPIGNFQDSFVEKVITVFPITQLNAVLKNTFLGEISNKLFLGASGDLQSYYDFYFGIKLQLFERDVTVLGTSIYFLILLVIFGILSVRFVRSS